MKDNKLDLSSIEDMKALYALVEENGLRLAIHGDITDVFVDYRNKTILDEEKQYAKWEVENFLFTIRGNDIFSYSYTTGKTVAKVEEFPKLNDYQSEAFDYLKKRAAEVENPFLVAHYNHLLWKSPKGIKNRHYAEQAINGYLKLIPALIEQYEREKNGEYHYLASQKLDCLIELVAEVKVAAEELRQLVRLVLFNIKAIPFYVKNSLLEKMLEKNRLFSENDFVGALALFENEYLNKTKKKDLYYWINGYVETALRISIRIGNDPRLWQNRLGDLYVLMAEGETEADRMWMKLTALNYAADAYFKAGNDLQKKEIEKQIFELKPEVKLS